MQNSDPRRNFIYLLNFVSNDCLGIHIEIPSGLPYFFHFPCFYFNAAHILLLNFPCFFSQYQFMIRNLFLLDLLKKTRKWPFPGLKPGIQLLISRFFIFRSGPGSQIWVLNLIFTSYFNSSFNLFLSNC